MGVTLDYLSSGLPVPVALSLVALIGYWVGKRRRTHVDKSQARAEIGRAQAVIKDLETISQQVRVGLATHHASILQFKERIADLGQQDPTLRQQDFFNEAEKILQPTLELASQIAQAYDEIRQQTDSLASNNAAGDVDPLKKLTSRSTMDQTLKTLFAIFSRYGNKFSVVLFDIDNFQKWNAEKGTAKGDELLRHVAQLLSSSVRETDMVVRFGGEEFLLLLPETDLAGACILAERLRAKFAKQSAATVSAGVASAIDTDNPKSLLARADSALYSAKSSGRNRVYQHTGRQIVEIVPTDLQAQLAGTGRVPRRAGEETVKEEATPMTVKFPRTGTNS